jgi:hypothetical protein
VLGKTIIILNDAQLAVQLLEKRSVIHSLRPQQTFTDMYDKMVPEMRNGKLISTGQAGMKFSEHSESQSMSEKPERTFIKR